METDKDSTAASVDEAEETLDKPEQRNAGDAGVTPSSGSSYRRAGNLPDDKMLQAILADRRWSLDRNKVKSATSPGRKGGKIKEDTPRPRPKGASLLLARELQQKRRQAYHQQGLGPSELYTDKDRAAAVTMGDQDIKTSLKVKRRGERASALPDDLDWTVYLTEAQKAIVTDNIETALTCAQKAVSCSGRDPGTLAVRGRCYLLLGRLDEAFNDAKEALRSEPSMVKAILVQAESLYGMGEFERALVLYERGARNRPDMSAFCRGGHKCREAILNAIGGEDFPEGTDSDQIGEEGAPTRGKESVQPRITTADPFGDSSRQRESRLEAPVSRGSGRSQASALSHSGKTNLLIPEIHTSKLASKRLLGGLSNDKEFLSSLVNRRGLTKVVPASLAKGLRSAPDRGKEEEGVEATKSKDRNFIGSSGGEVVAKAKQALDALEHLETFLWQRNPTGLNRIGGSPDGTKSTRLQRGSVASRRKGLRKTKTRAKTDKMRQRSLIVKKVSTVLRKLETLDGKAWAAALREGEVLVEEVKSGGDAVGGDANIAAVFCRLLVGVGAALPRAGRSEDALALLTDAIHIAHARDLVEDEQLATEWQGRVLANRGQHQEAVTVWQMCLTTATSYQRPTLFLLLARGYLAMLENEKAKEYCRLCVSEANMDTSELPTGQMVQAQGEDRMVMPQGDERRVITQREERGVKTREDLELKGNSETAVTALLTLAGLEADTGESKEALKVLKEAEPHLTHCPSLVPQFTVLHHTLMQETMHSCTQK